jgi:RNA polymerase sigma-70 factor, ECF subfamily
METVQVRPSVGPRPGADFVDCYRAHYRRLVRALRLSGADAATAEDVAQEAFARALARWRRVSRGTNPPGYVYTSGFRLMQRAQLQRAKQGLTEPSTDDPSSSRPDAEATTTVAVESVLRAMPPRRRACAVMCFVVGLSVHEAADALDIADGTVRKHLDEARRDLAAGLA